MSDMLAPQRDLNGCLCLRIRTQLLIHALDLKLGSINVDPLSKWDFRAHPCGAADITSVIRGRESWQLCENISTYYL